MLAVGFKVSTQGDLAKACTVPQTVSTWPCTLPRLGGSQHTIAKGAVFKNDPINYLVTPNTRIFNLVHPITGISESIIPITISPTNQPSD